MTFVPWLPGQPGWRELGCHLPPPEPGGSGLARSRLHPPGVAERNRPCPATRPCLLSTGSSHPWVTSPQLAPGDSQPSARGGALGGGEGGAAGGRGCSSWRQRQVLPPRRHPARRRRLPLLRLHLRAPTGDGLLGWESHRPRHPPHRTRGWVGCAPRAQRVAELPRGLRGLSPPSAGPVPTPAHGSCAFQGKNAHFQVSKSCPGCPVTPARQGEVRGRKGTVRCSPVCRGGNGRGGCRSG